MSDSSSQAAQPSESDFHDSHPIDADKKEETTPSIGDLSSIETDIETPHSASHVIGDTSKVEESLQSAEDSQPAEGSSPAEGSQLADGSQSEALGDMSLLGEAFAEMNEDTAPNDDAQGNTDIPVLNESIETPTESRIVSPDTQSASIPLLEQEATVFAEMLKPASSTQPASTTEVETPIASQIADENNSTPESVNLDSEIDETPLFDSPTAENNTNITEMHSSLEMAAELLSEAVPSQAQTQSQTQSQAAETKTEIDTNTDLTGDAALAALLEDEEADAAETKALEPETTPAIDSSMLESPTEIGTSIDEKIAIAASESEILLEDSTFEINETPISAIETDDSAHSEFSATFAEGLNSDDIEVETSKTETTETQASESTEFSSTEISEFNPDVDLSSEAAVTQQASHSVGILSQGLDAEENQNNLNISIPFELHSQLSSKIDELVIQATSSITEELHSQLTTQLDNLLSNAVESVLPKLVNQMAGELRTDINARIKDQLPNIINGVLNKTRLQK